MPVEDKKGAQTSVRLTRGKIRLLEILISRIPEY